MAKDREGKVVGSKGEEAGYLVLINSSIVRYLPTSCSPLSLQFQRLNGLEFSFLSLVAVYSQRENSQLLVAIDSLSLSRAAGVQTSSQLYGHFASALPLPLPRSPRTISHTVHSLPHQLHHKFHFREGLYLI